MMSLESSKESRVPCSGLLQNSLLIVAVVYVNKPKSSRVTHGPFKVVHKRPRKVTTHVSAASARSQYVIQKVTAKRGK